MTDNPPKRNSKTKEYILLWLADLIVIWATAILLFLLLGSNPFLQGGRIVLLLAAIAYIPAGVYMYNNYVLQRSATIDKVFATSFKAIVLHGLVFLSMAAFLHLQYSMTFYVCFYVALGITFPLINIVFRKFIKRARRKGRSLTRVAIVGTNPVALRLSESMMRDSGFGYKIIGFFDEKPVDGFNANYLGNLESLEEYAREHKIDEIFFAIASEQVGELPRVVKIAEDNMLNFYYVPRISPYVTGMFTLNNIGSVPVMTLRRNPLSILWKRASKRTFDIAFSSFFLLVSPVIFIPVAIGIKLSSPGPIFFRQERTGYKGKSFKCYKFRTMRVNSDADRAQATADDPRKTRFGDMLRRTSIDELPQFINVWLGDMSVVGPRPHMLKHTEDYTALVDKYMVRHVVKPGITGWAQVNGYRGITDELWKMEKRVECDVWYIENWTFSLDLKIIMRTIANAVRGEKNAF